MKYFLPALPARRRAGTPAPLGSFATHCLALLLVVLLWPAVAVAYFDPLVEAGIDRLPGAHLPADAKMVDQQGKTARLGQYLGGPPVIFAPVVYDCPNLCGLTLEGLFGALAGAGLQVGRDYRVIAVGIDPREGPAQAEKDLAGLAKRWPIEPVGVRFLTGSPEAVHQVTAAMGVRSGWDAEHQQYAHISAVAVTTSDGRLSRWLSGVQFDPRALRLAVVEAGRGRVGTLGDQVLLLCYGYDPVRGRYGWAVRRMLTAGAAVTLAAMAFFIGRYWYREGRGRP